MRITRRPSGGRGEYELAEEYRDLRARDLINYNISLELPEDLLIHTRIYVSDQGGKLRLRRRGADMQIQRQLTAAFLMPDSQREFVTLGGGEPILQEGLYAVEHIPASTVRLIGPQTAVLKVNKLIAANRSHLAEEINLRQRSMMLKEVWKRRDEFPDEIAELLQRHETIVRSGTMTRAALTAAAQIRALVAQRSADLGIIYEERGDVLPKLAEALRYEPPKPNIIIDDVDPEDIELKKRTAKEWKRWANSRGPSAAKFRRAVRDAYRATCFICGAHYPRTDYGNAPGVDAAHILPWSEFDLDEVYNGLCLCKLHHWAFDEAIIRVRFEGGSYVSEMPNEAAQGIAASNPNFSLDRLRANLGVIPEVRLPLDRRQWPRPQLLDVLAETV
jgi:putative restriction endonuclease